MDWAEGVAFRYADPKFRTRDRYLSRNDYLFGRPSPASAVKCSKEFTRCAGKALNLDRVFHDLRHTFAVWYLTAPSEKNTDFRLVALKNILGHSSLETTMIYTKLLPNQLRL
jgi:integrase